MKRLLLVEDNRDLCDLYRAELEMDGYRVLVEHDGKSGLKRALEEKPDLVIMDISLPDKMDGLESMSRILGQDNSISVIIHTAYSQYRDNFMSWAADEYIVKSGNLTPLKQAISRVLNLGQSDERGAKSRVEESSQSHGRSA
ncbi:MAG: response regulator [Planctomycetota bacterium]